MRKYRPIKNAVSRMARLNSYRRIVVKIGSALLVDRASGNLHAAWLESLIADVAGLAEAGSEVILVSSGAIALGRGRLGLPKGALALDQAQAAASVGQIALAHAYSNKLGNHGLTAAQILLTLEDTENRQRYLNARETIGTLLKHRAIPVINENDTVATTEIRYGDNDRLAARVATMIGADLLILLSDIDGLYTAPPNSDPNATLIPLVERITPEIEAIAGGAGSEFSRGGMKTKIDAGKIACGAGTAMIITLGKRINPLAAIDAGEPATWFLPQDNPVTARKKWIAGSLDARGVIVADDGAIKALRSGKSLLPAGCVRTEGKFERGDMVVIQSLDGLELGRGLIAFDRGEADMILGRKSHEIETVLGYMGGSVMIHRDDMVLRGE